MGLLSYTFLCIAQCNAFPSIHARKGKRSHLYAMKTFEPYY